MPYRGFQGTGSSLVNTNQPANTAAPYSQNSATVLLWETSEISTGTAATGLAGSSMLLNPRNPSGLMRASINDYSELSAAVPSSIGVVSVIRSGQNARRMRRNGVTLASDAAGSSGVGGDTFLIGAQNPSYPDAHRVALHWIGGDLLDGQETNIVAAIRDFAAALPSPAPI